MFKVSLVNLHPHCCHLYWLHLWDLEARRLMFSFFVFHVFRFFFIVLFLHFPLFHCFLFPFFMFFFLFGRSKRKNRREVHTVRRLIFLCEDSILGLRRTRIRNGPLEGPVFSCFPLFFFPPKSVYFFLVFLPKIFHCRH